MSQESDLAKYLQSLRRPSGSEPASGVTQQAEVLQETFNLDHPHAPSSQFHPQAQCGRARQQNMVPMDPWRGSAIASDFFPAHFWAHLMESPNEQDNEKEITSDRADSVADFLLKSTVFINKAYAALHPKSAEVANQLAKVSHDILKIYSRLFEIDLESASADEYAPIRLTPPSSPSALFSDPEKTTPQAEMHRKLYHQRLAAVEALAGTSTTSSYYLKLEPGAENVADIFKRAWGPRSAARLVNSLALRRSAAYKLADNRSRLSSQAEQWDTEFQSTPTPPMQLVQSDPRLRSVTPESSQTLSAKPANQYPTPRSPATASTQPVFTWAKVAAIPPRQGREDRLGPKINVRSSMSSFKHDATAPAMLRSNIDEALEKQGRIVFVKGCNEATKLRDITKRITEGPLMSILLEKGASCPALSACIIFMDATQARDFVDRNDTAIQSTGHTIYGPGTQVVRGGPWPEDDEIRAMITRRERRRLTFSAGGLFQKVSRDTFKADIYTIAGKANVELLWLFNTGNATVVFASVRVARAVKNRFIAQTSGQSLYEGLRISYSSDPCEKELHLVTQMLSGPERTLAGTVKKS